MAKQRTTGGPRTRRQLTEEDLQRRREYKSRAERERLWQRRVLIVTAVLVGLSLLVLAYGVLNERAIAPRQAISTVNGDKIITRDFQDRVRLERWLTAQNIRDLYNYVGGNLDLVGQYLGQDYANQVSQQISSLQRPQLLGSQVLDNMEEERLLAQAAPDLGASADDAAVERRVDEFLAGQAGLALPPLQSPTPTTAPTITPTPLVSPTPSSTPAPTATATSAPTEVAAAAPTSATPAAETPAAETATPEGTVEAELTTTPAATFTPTATLDATQIVGTAQAVGTQWYEDATSGANVDRKTIHNLFYYDALRSAIFDKLAANVPTEELQVNARHMLFAFDPANPSGAAAPTDEQRQAALDRANAALAALQAGEPFASLAQAVSDDTGSAARGGELGWTSPDNYAANFKDNVLSADLGAIVGPFETEFGYHIIQVHGREVRPLSASDLRTRQSQEYQDWLNKLKADAKIERRGDWLDRIPSEPTYSELLGDIIPAQ